jgi:hypothetical protein
MGMTVAAVIRMAVEKAAMAMVGMMTDTVMGITTMMGTETAKATVVGIMGMTVAAVIRMAVEKAAMAMVGMMTVMRTDTVMGITTVTIREIRETNLE